jgi:mutator protein MutT
VLVCQRPSDTTFPGYWEFPGGKLEPGESLEQCLVREVREELGIDIRPVAALTPVEHDYPSARIRLHPYLCVHTGGDPQPLGCQALRWIDPARLSEYHFPPANEGLLTEVADRLAAGLPLRG